MKIDMSPDAITGRMIALDQLWELAVALKSSVILEESLDILTDSAPALEKNIENEQ
jgi:hypothetical protein